MHREEAQNARTACWGKNACVAAASQSTFPNINQTPLRLLAVLALALPALANVCTPLQVPANGPFPAIGSNGVDGIGWSSARVQWTSDFSPSASTAQRVEYSTAEEWDGHPGKYRHITAQLSQTPASNRTIQGGILSNLLPATTYHVHGQSFQGGAWCNSADQTFATNAKPAGTIIPPALPQTVDTTRPALKGAHWVYGSNCGMSAGSGYAIETANWQDCLNHMNSANGDDLAAPPGVYHITGVNIHNSENAVPITCSTAPNVCVQRGKAPGNGAQVMLGAAFYGAPPSPINPGIPYKVVNASGSQFQLSYDGVTPVTFLSSGVSVQYLLWPLAQPRAAIHSTAEPARLPPVGVRLGADSLAQYKPHMVELRSMDPLASALNFGPLAVNLTFENIAFSTDPAVATSSVEADPVGFRFPLQLGFSNSGIVFDQCAFVPAPAPGRTLGIDIDGTNAAIVNSYAVFDWWQPGYFASSLLNITSAKTIHLPAHSWTWVGSKGTKKTCSYNEGVLTINGAGSGAVYVWDNPDPPACSSGAQITTGLSATSTVPGMVVTNAAKPDFPMKAYKTVLGYTIEENAGFNILGFDIASGAITTSNEYIRGNFFNPGHSKQAAEGATGIDLTAYGPFKFDNNYILGSGIGGIFWDDGLSFGTICGRSGECLIQNVIGNLTVTRNTMTTDTVHWNYDSPGWDGGNRYWRNVNEQKAGRYALYDGNVIGPWYAQVGQGECALHEIFGPRYQIGSYPYYGSSSDWTFTNNTCLNTGSTGLTTSYSFGTYVWFPYPIGNVLIQNDLFYNNNGYAQTPHNMPFRSNGHVINDPKAGACPTGGLSHWAQGENYQMDHLTALGQGGCQSGFLDFVGDLSSGGVTNSILNLVEDPGAFATNTRTGTYFHDEGYYNGPCVGAQGSDLFSCIHNWNWGGNVILATWKNSHPDARTDFTASDIANAQSAFHDHPAYWPNAPTLAGRLRQVSPAQSENDFRLKASASYGNATRASTDGKTIGVNMEELEQHQGKVSNVHFLEGAELTATSATLSFLAPDTYACGVDWGTTAFYNGSGNWTRVSSPQPAGGREQSVRLSGLPAHALIHYRLNCQVSQPTGSLQLP